MTSPLSILTAGDIALHAEVILAAYYEISDKKARRRKEWLVKDVADLYARFHGGARRTRAEAAILTPLGLTLRDYVGAKDSLPSGLAKEIFREMINYHDDSLETEALIIGLDSRGAHIYKNVCGRSSCQDSIGFAAIGIGARHAESHLMLRRYSRIKEADETMLRIHFAKRLGETAPGVGRDTDLFVIGREFGTAPFNKPELKILDAIFDEHKSANETADVQAKARIQDFLVELAKQSQSGSAGPGATP